ncbi:MAG: PilZ domain-containing protein [Bacteriovoracaceae bacterium]|nr:PilZ domain-containing protein [Bacteriovoracaceae bacterium]
MARHLNLVQSDFEKLEKRVLPRFPFCYLIFKSDNSNERVFEVKDISHSGMQLALKAGDSKEREGESLRGEIHWLGKSLKVQGNVKWTKENRLGVEFSGQATQRESVDEFLKIEHFAQSLKPLHRPELGLELPPKLKYWLRSDGPTEIFVWRHNDGELSKFQILIMENFIEWKDTRGLETGRVISKRDIETPLISEDEFVFKLDAGIDDVKIEMAKKLLNNVDKDKLSEDALDFLLMKLS